MKAFWLELRTRTQEGDLLICLPPYKETCSCQKLYVASMAECCLRKRGGEMLTPAFAGDCPKYFMHVTVPHEIGTTPSPLFARQETETQRGPGTCSGPCWSVGDWQARAERARQPSAEPASSCPVLEDALVVERHLDVE